MNAGANSSGTIYGGDQKQVDTHEIRIKHRGVVFRTLTYKAAGNELKFEIARDPQTNSEKDVVIPDEMRIVSRQHLVVRISGDRCYVTVPEEATNGTFLNGIDIRGGAEQCLKDGDTILIDNQKRNSPDSVMIEYSQKSSGDLEKNMEFSLDNQKQVFIGREKKQGVSNIVINHPKVSKEHFKVFLSSGNWFVEDLNSTNGTYLNGVKLTGTKKLNNNDSIKIVNAKFVFKLQPTCKLEYTEVTQGVSIIANNIGLFVMEKKEKQLFASKKILISNISLMIKPGEFVALVGGSGAGKSTLMKCLCGFTPATSGSVMINGEDFYSNYERLKESIGYVPQQDIVYDNLTVREMLTYSAKLRMPTDSTASDIDKRVNEVVGYVNLQNNVEARIAKLSGGQKKRVSIAVELISSPKLLFLDEPTSGLDPGMDRVIMELLRDLSKKGTTIVLVTHATSNINELCDKVAFLAKEEEFAGDKKGVGKLCFFGPPRAMTSHFGAGDIPSIYNKIDDRDYVKKIRSKFESEGEYSELSKYLKTTGNAKKTSKIKDSKHSSSMKQLLTLVSRYFKLITSDKKSLFIIIGQAPIMLLVLKLISKADAFDTFESAKKILFTISFMAVLMGILNSFLEVCKEKEIVKREYSANLRLFPYLFSKMIVLMSFGIIQTLFLTGGVFWILDIPQKYIIFGAKAEFFISVLLVLTASTALGLLISSFSKTTEMATLMMPVAIIPQLAFSGILFELSGVTQQISNFVTTKWSMGALGSIIDINSLNPVIARDFPDIAKSVLRERKLESIYEHTVWSLLNSWYALLAFTFVSILLSYYFLKKNLRER